MVADPLVEVYRYNTGSSRPVFPYDVFIPCHDEPEYLVEGLRDTAAAVLNAKSVHCVFEGGTIKEVHALIGQQATTDMVLVLDADLELGRGPFKMFPTEIIGDEDQYVHLWHVRNPINGLEYGHGGPKLFNCLQLADATLLTGVDMTTAFDKGMVIHTECVGTHSFNWSAGSTWRTAFREAAKLTRFRGTVGNDEDERMEANKRLQLWMFYANAESAYGEFCLDGAVAGNAYALQNESLAQINDYSWLYGQFKQRFPNDY